MADTLGKQNPFRYRGYVYDEETELYYLKIRYYDCDKMRFLNPDTILATCQGVLGTNVYAYCDNHPIRRIDENGELWNFITTFCNKVKEVVVQAVETVKECIEDTFGIAVYWEKTDSHETDFLIGKYESGITVTELMYGNDDKPIVFYRKYTEDGSSWGVSINIGKVNTSFDAGTDGLNCSVGYDNNSLDVGIGLKEVSVGASKSVTHGRTTTTSYVKGSVRPLVVLAVVVAAKTGVGAALALKAGMAYMVPA